MSSFFLSSYFILTFSLFNTLLMMSSLRIGSRQQIQGRKRKKIPRMHITPQDVCQEGSSQRAKWYKDMPTGTISSSKRPCTASLFRILSKLSWLYPYPQDVIDHISRLCTESGGMRIIFFFIVYISSCLRRLPIMGYSISSK